MGRQRAIRLNMNRTFEEKTFKTDVNKLKAGKNDEVMFEPACVFTEEKTKLFWVIPRFWKIPRNLVLFVDGAKNCLKFKEKDETMMPFWTKPEATEHVKKEIAKARLKFKPMTWGQIIFLAIPICLVVALQLYEMSRPF